MKGAVTTQPRAITPDHMIEFYRSLKRRLRIDSRWAMLVSMSALRALRVLGLRGVLLEGLRRIGVLESYRLGGIHVSSSLDFRALRMLREAGIRVEAVDDGLIARLEGYVLWAPEPAYFERLVDIVKHYGLLEVEDRTVLNVGAYIGDTPLPCKRNGQGDSVRASIPRDSTPERRGK